MSLTRREAATPRCAAVLPFCAQTLPTIEFGHPGEPRHPNRDFWVTVNGNFLDQCVLEWAKLLGDRRGDHHWMQIVSDPTKFVSCLNI